jgi:hypothetical protein
VGPNRESCDFFSGTAQLFFAFADNSSMNVSLTSEQCRLSGGSFGAHGRAAFTGDRRQRRTERVAPGGSDSTSGAPVRISAGTMSGGTQ